MIRMRNSSDQSDRSQNLKAVTGTLRPIFFKLVGSVAIMLLLSACVAIRPTTTVLHPSKVISTHQVVEILTATNRALTTDGGFSAVRSGTLTYELYEISVPAGVHSTEIPFPKSSPDPTSHFVVLSRKSLDQEQFVTAVSRKSIATGSAALYVHGYNQTYQEALFRLAQVSADSNLGGPAILFSWPSDATLLGYVADRDASLASRDDLVDVIRTISGMTPIRQLIVAGHSMGGFLVMEATRQIKLANERAVLDKIGIVLAAPDIDPEVFKTQLSLVGRMNPPILIMVSREDRALEIAGLLSGDRPRVGRLDVSDPRVQAVVQEAGVLVLDITSAQPGDLFKHDGFASMATFLGRLASDRGTAVPFATRSGLLVYDSTRSMLVSPSRVDAQ
ncbi:alpha/beta hydrolase [Devosia submarina]|uniref:alpha/beta hydrolase n=1 Tax=Devosia submarina TaxID=1173082 RepID=UPI000D334615|nr:alpha/beta fold hydrolase [Devosia submarina]